MATIFLGPKRRKNLQVCAALGFVKYERHVGLSGYRPGAGRLAPLITGDARSFDIGGTDIAQVVENMDDYLTPELQKRRRDLE
jgi:hypothetical protein